MNAHLRANLLLLAATVLLGCVAYPLTLWAIGQVVFPDKAAGSLIERDGQPIGSRLIAQPFRGPEYFHPRPSAAGYDAAASGGSNYAASNPKLRARVAQSLVPLVRYRGGPKKGQRIGPDIEEWVRQKRLQGQPLAEGAASRFEQWLQEHSEVELVEIPADGVMASGSGLDPHITRKNALSQLDRVVNAWADKMGAKPEAIRQTIEKLLARKAAAPFGGLAGAELVNVLEVNVALLDAMNEIARGTK